MQAATAERPGSKAEAMRRLGALALSAKWASSPTLTLTLTLTCPTQDSPRATLLRMPPFPPSKRARLKIPFGTIPPPPLCLSYSGRRDRINSVPNLIRYEM